MATRDETSRCVPVAGETRPHKTGFLSCARSFFALLLCLSFLQHSCVTSYLVSGNSMLPNFVDGDRVVVARMPSFLGDPERGDTVIVEVNGEILIKRVVGLPGEVITIGHGNVLEDGQFIADLTPASFRDDRDMPPVCLASDEYFLLGDHRKVSIDSREFGPVRRRDIIGRVILRLAQNDDDDDPGSGRGVEAGSR